MSNLEHQKKLTDGKGWKQVLVEHAKGRIEQAIRIMGIIIINKTISSLNPFFHG